MEATRSDADHVLWGGISDSCSEHSGSEAARRAKKIPILKGVRCYDYSSDCNTEGSDYGDEFPTKRFPGASPGHDPISAPGVAQDTEEQLYKQVPADSDGELTSLGSKGHPGSCVPCVFAARKEGCDKDVRCEFCHFSHMSSDSKRAGGRGRPCKGTRMRYRKQVSRLLQMAEVNPRNFDPNSVALPPSIDGNAYLKAKVVAQLHERRIKALAITTVDEWMQQRASGWQESARFSL